MDKTAIKNFAIQARKDLIAGVKQKAYEYGIDEKTTGNEAHTGALLNGRILTPEEQTQRNELLQLIRSKGYAQVMEEVAYTWFNRFIALRFMEVNEYLPSRIRVFTNEKNEFQPEILSEALHLDLEGLDKVKVISLLETNQTEELYKYLLITQCNALNSALPEMFEKIQNCTELLFPNNLLKEGSVLSSMISNIPQDDWRDAVEIIGWLYQYYNTEVKDETFALLSKNVKITKERIPAATQLFTPDWIVRYMVENSLGRIWIEGHPSNDLKSTWKYYLDEADQEPEVEEQLKKIRADYAKIKPEEIRVIDPCMGSGHILVYAFDVLMQIYISSGYSERDAAKNILKNNLYGLDIDDRAYQLSYFAVMMKARKYCRTIFSAGVWPNLYSIQESNFVTPELIEYVAGGDNSIKYDLKAIVDALHDAKEYGSILNIQKMNYKNILDRIEEIQAKKMNDLQLMTLHKSISDYLLPLIKQAQTMSQKYDVVVTNPPYMSSSGMSAKLSAYVKTTYPNSKSDLFAVFIERCREMTRSNGFQAMITQPSFLFLSSFEKLRSKIITQNTISSLIHMGRGIFGIDFGSTAFVIKKQHIKNHTGCYFKLHERTFQYIDPDDIGKLFLSSKMNTSFKYDFSQYNTQTEDISKDVYSGKELQLYYETKQEHFFKISGIPIAYWVSKNVIRDFEIGTMFSEIGFPKVGMQTSNNDKFLRFWHEVKYNEFTSDSKKWIKYIKGGQYRRWYGNLEYVVWYNGTPSFLLQQKNARVLPESELEIPKCTWTDLASTRFSCRIAPVDSFHDISGHCFYPDNKNYFFLLALSNTKVFQLLIDLLNSSFHYQVGDVARIPVIIDDAYSVKIISEENVNISKIDWDSYEKSWDFACHPFVTQNRSNHLFETFANWQQFADNQFIKLKTNEEELNRIFINIYNLQNELTPEVEDKDITIRKADLSREIRSLLSYAVGVNFGRYSLDVEGLAYAGGGWESCKYTTIIPDKDNILPMTDDVYFEDDIVSKVVDFIKIVYGVETLEENLQFIADALGNKGNSSRAVIRNYFLNDFYKDHLQIYQKRPIYWLFDSGKKNGFKALIYMHRYKPDLLATMRTDYVHEQQERYRTQLQHLEASLMHASPSDQAKINKQIGKIKEQSLELLGYEEKIHHLADQMIDIDLDDGVKVNYAKFEDVLAPIK